MVNPLRLTDSSADPPLIEAITSAAARNQGLISLLSSPLTPPLLSHLLSSPLTPLLSLLLKGFVQKTEERVAPNLDLMRALLDAGADTFAKVHACNLRAVSPCISLRLPALHLCILFLLRL